ncbi:hypothetical protein CO018_01810 [Candidatus Beckwithbacteria bacterium CG_4_9_14_0_2_um_filter_47_11]|uniref:CoA-binding domain-containing protein n=1 Tax=Candidatus Beckwithbacteria bacterium CG_4_9_14_0_2_um_filter_47_11 TaxID=1974494 RepID=A0A2M8G491_9BACT|nr:MAG: hypothetical protein CO018_01810 [Candidatus Beckwithbacteria bacterium CG_4_9_14_0_2_um_filter_47_11]
MDNFFKPRSIALIGASKDKTKVGYNLWQKLKAYPGRLYPVNPRFGYQRVTDIKVRIDLAVVAIPARFVPGVLTDCVAKKVKAVIVISSGFAELGEAGVSLPPPPVPFLGPNCFGVANPSRRLDTTFAKVDPPPGNIGLISQSGALASYLFNWARQEHLGFSKFISLGNRLGLTENDFLEYLGNDSATKIIALYLESFADGLGWLKLASRISRKKPIIVLFGGQTPAGRLASQSHTASLSPAGAVVTAALNQSGCLQAKTITDFTNLLEVFSLEPELKDNDLAIVTNAGGPAILATDTASSLNLDVAKAVDVLGDAGAGRFSQALNEVLKDKTRDAYLIIITPQANTQIESTCRAIVRRFRSVKKPLIVSLLTGRLTETAGNILRQNRIATIELPQEAVTGLAALLQWYRGHKLDLYPARRSYPIHSPSGTLPEGRLTWKQAQGLIRRYQLPLVKTITLDQPVKPADFSWPVVLKADPSAGAHRTEAKAIYLNLKTGVAVKTAYRRLAQKFPLILAQPQLTAGHELFIGLKREPGWPVLLTLGGGGVYTELYRDLARVFLPVNEKLIANLLRQTRIGQIIFGYRNGVKLAVKAIVKLILNACQLIEEFQSVQELEINPAILTETSVTIVDLKITTFRDSP